MLSDDDVVASYGPPRSLLKLNQNWFCLIEQASDMSKNKLSVIIHECCLNKTTKTINKLTNEQPSSHFFLTDPLLAY